MPASSAPWKMLCPTPSLTCIALPDASFAGSSNDPNWSSDVSGMQALASRNFGEDH